MQKDLAEVIAEITLSGATGILSMSVHSDTSLFKIFFKNGSVYHATYGGCRDRESLFKISELLFLTGSFLPGASIDAKNTRLISNEEIIFLAKKANKTIEWNGNWDGRPKSSQDSGISSNTIDSKVVAMMGEELVNIIGPVEPMVLAKAYDTCNLKQGALISKSQFQILVKTISGQLPKEHKEPFLNRFV